MKAKTYTSLELKKAMELGYKITKIHAAVEYQQCTGLMKAYVEEYIRMKICCSGVLNEEQCEQINNIHKSMGLNVHIKPSDTSDNPGQRQVAKILLNSLWGKFGQRANMKQYKFPSKYTEFVRNMTDNTVIPLSWEILGENMVEFAFSEDAANTLEPEFISEITAVFTTANARLR